MKRRSWTASWTGLTGLLAVALAGTGPTTAGAQTAAADTSFQVAALRTPTAPAFVILGIEPTAIERPATPRAFMLSLLSAATAGGTVIPENYALQVAPYWLASRPALEFDRYFDPGPLQALLQSLSIAFATAARDDATGVGFGVRAAPFPGRPGAQLLGAVAAVDSLLAENRRLPEALALAADSLDELTLRRDRAPPGPERERLDAEVRRLDARLAELERRAGMVDDSLRVRADRLKELDHERVGFVLQLASGLAADFPGARFDDGALTRLGAWATAGYRLDHPRLDLLGLLRYQHDRAADQDLVDIGARFVLQWGRLASSAEAVVRSATGAAPSQAGNNGTPAFENSQRLVGLVEYRATDDLVLTASFGRDFELAVDGAPLVAMIGIDLLLGALPEVLGRRTGAGRTRR